VRIACKLPVRTCDCRALCACVRACIRGCVRATRCEFARVQALESARAPVRTCAHMRAHTCGLRADTHASECNGIAARCNITRRQ